MRLYLRSLTRCTPRALVLFAVFALEACGLQATEVDVVVTDAHSQQFTVRSGERVTLDGSLLLGAAQQGAIYHWSLLDGPDIVIADASAPTLVFTAPEVTDPTLLVIKLTATTDEASVTVLYTLTVLSADTICADCADLSCGADDGCGSSCGNADDDGCTCDDGNACSSGETYLLRVCGGGTCSNTETCDADCTAASCGDGFMNPVAAEACDDTNTLDGDCCSADCLTATAAGTSCGDGVCNECNGTGTCVATASRIAGPGCTEAATECSNADTCDGLGSCSVNDLPDGTSCTGSTCSEGGCGTINDPVAHWKLDETIGTTAVDSAGTNDGTLEGDPVWTTAGHLGTNGGLIFNEVDDRVAIADFDWGTAVSIAVWFYQDERSGTSHQTLFAGGKNTASQVMLRIREDNATNANKLEVFVRNSSGTSSSIYGSIPSLPDWHHVVVTIQAGDTKLYLDGSEDATSTNPTTWADPTGPMYMGSNTGGGSKWFGGTLDEMRVYSRILNATEVTELYEWTDGAGDTTNPVQASPFAGLTQLTPPPVLSNPVIIDEDDPFWDPVHIDFTMADNTDYLFIPPKDRSLGGQFRLRTQGSHTNNYRVIGGFWDINTDEFSPAYANGGAQGILLFPTDMNGVAFYEGTRVNMNYRSLDVFKGKGTRDTFGPMQIIVQNCYIEGTESDSVGIHSDTIESYAGFTKATFENCQVYTGGAGIFLPRRNSNDNGKMSTKNIRFYRLHMAVDDAAMLMGTEPTERVFYTYNPNNNDVVDYDSADLEETYVSGYSNSQATRTFDQLCFPHRSQSITTVYRDRMEINDPGASMDGLTIWKGPPSWTNDSDAPGATNTGLSYVSPH